jgi:DNA polymerase-3 subunit delta'
MISSADEFLLDNFAILLAKEIFCVGENKPCLSCIHCQKIEHSNMVDLSIYPKSDKPLVTEDINEIVNDCLIRAMESEYKVYILKNFHLCTVQAQNKILKTLEEPPQNVVFIITSNNDGLILPTISSRAKKINVNLLSKDDCNNILKGLNIDNSEILSGMSGGNVSMALNLSKNADPLNIVKLVINTMLNLRASSDIIKYSSLILSLKKDFVFFLDTMQLILRDISVFDSGKINFEMFKSDIEKLSQIYNKEQLYKISSKINEIYGKLSFNCNINGVVDKFLLDILEVKFLCQK